MPGNPTTATQIVEQADARLATLLRHADALPDHAVSAEFAGERVADVFAHLHGWHQLLLGWLAAERQGSAPAFPADGYDWDQLEALNASLISARSHETHSQLREKLEDSHRQVCDAIRARDDDTLFDAHARPWLDGGSLGEVAHQCLGRHYEWGETMLGQCAL